MLLDMPDEYAMAFVSHSGRDPSNGQDNLAVVQRGVIPDSLGELIGQPDETEMAEMVCCFDFKRHGTFQKCEALI